MNCAVAGTVWVSYDDSARMFIGCRMWVRASETIAAGMVAENSIVCRVSGVLREQPLDVGQEAEVEHLVGLVEHQRLHVADVEGAAVHQVDQPARGADDDVDALLERVELRVVGHAAVDGEHADAAVLAGQRRGRWRPGARARGSARRPAPAACRARRARRSRGRAGRRCAAGSGCRTPASCRCRCAPGRSGRCPSGRPRGSSPGWRTGSRCRRARARRRSRGAPRALGRWSGSCRSLGADRGRSAADPASDRASGARPSVASTHRSRCPHLGRSGPRWCLGAPGVWPHPIGSLRT